MSLLKNIAKILGLKGRSPYVVALEFGPSTIKVMGVRVAPVRSVDFCSIIDLPAGQDDNSLVKAIQAALKDKKLPSKAACLNFSDESLTVRRISMPAMKEDDIADALPWQAADKVHFDMETATAGFKRVAAAHEKDRAGMVEILFAATPCSLIEKRLRVMKGSGLNPVAVSIAPSGIETILKYDDEAPPSGTVMVVDFGHSHTDISFYKNRDLEFVRTIRTGSNNITEAISGALGVGPEEAEKIKASLGIAYERVTLEGGIDSIRVLSAMRPVIEALSREVKRSIDYYAHEHGGEAVSSVYLAGGGSRLKNLDKYLAEELNLPVSRMRMPKGIDISKAGIKGDGEEASVIALIGTAIGYPVQIDLLPREFKAEKFMAIGKALSIAGSVIIAVILVVFFVILKIGARDCEAKLQKLKSEMVTLEPVRELRDRVAEKRTLMTQTRKSELPLGQIMKELSNVTPPNTIFSSLRINSKAKTLDISGVINEKIDAAQNILSEFMGKLEKSKYFKEAQMTSLTGGAAVQRGPQDKQGPVARSNFSINCLLE